MKLILLIFLSASLSAGHVLPNPGDGLVARANQVLTNPDNEPDYVDPVTGNTTPKSRILSGVGPAEADARWFDWDETCSDKDHRKKIMTAFSNVMLLSEWTFTHLEQLQNALPKPPGSSPNTINRKYIFENDPAYAQMFGAHDHALAYVKETFNKVKTNGKKPPNERNQAGPGALRFICNADNAVMNGGKSAPVCGTGDGAAHGVASVVNNEHIEPKYRFETSSSIIFCPAFFDALRFPSIDVVAAFDEPTLDEIECAERILLHEYMHLKWVRDMPGAPDDIGYLNVAKDAKNWKWRDIKGNPDSYAWLALYAYFNNNNVGCGNDVWPPGVKKPNKV